MAAVILATELQKWRSGFVARFGREPDRGDVDGDARAAVLLEQFKAARRRDERENEERPVPAQQPASPERATRSPRSSSPPPVASFLSRKPAAPHLPQHWSSPRRRSPATTPRRQLSEGQREIRFLRRELEAAWQETRRASEDAAAAAADARAARSAAAALGSDSQLACLEAREQAHRDALSALWAAHVSEREAARTRMERDAWKRHHAILQSPTAAGREALRLLRHFSAAARTVLDAGGAGTAPLLRELAEADDGFD
eukprot:TRINITY_DN8303_c0_g1_i2.p1 TRINITY_DN8303_c0_g1~~TRINITY_DN8303_c0_g1_i2.p1  ORF type:complete len:276 (+),score=110.32 TRINITY_DN8303_c0_g1_i2:55-828(+)